MNHALTAGAWWLVGWGNHGCAFFVCAERDESRPYGWRMAIRCVVLCKAERDESRPNGWRVAFK